ncbi:hypothetical protein ACJX0J_040027, partial [Zea mays]
MLSDIHFQRAWVQGVILPVSELQQSWQTTLEEMIGPVSSTFSSCQNKQRDDSSGQ